MGATVVLISFVMIHGVYLLVLKDLTPGLLSPLEGAKFVPQVIKHFYGGAGREVGGTWGLPIRQGPSD